MNFAIQTEQLGRIYKIRGGKKSEPRQLVALENVALIGSVAQAFPTLAAFSNLQLLGILTGLTVIFGVGSVFAFRWCEKQAREKGMIDMVTNY